MSLTPFALSNFPLGRRVDAFRLSGGALLLIALLAPVTTAWGLVKFDEGHDEIFATATAGIAYDSNIFASAGGEGDTTYNASLLLEYKRKAGMLGVDASLGWNISRFSRFSEENFADPQFAAEITKDSGRTTGSLKVDAKKENRADTAINIRTASWNYGADLNVKYPVIERYSISGELSYDRSDFLDNAALVDIDTYSVGTDLLYALNSERSLLAGYRFRTTDTSAHTTDLDHALTVGVTGKIVSKFTGAVRVGVQRRTIERRGQPNDSHNSATAAVSSTWTLTSRFNLTGELARDFATIATDASVDTSTASLQAQFAMNPKTALFGGVSYAHLAFLDTQQSGRHDDELSFNAGAAYTFSDRLKLTATYSYTENWSTLPTSDFHRHSFALTVSSHW